MPTFEIQGQVYHTVGSLLPLPNECPRFLQIYFMGDDIAGAKHRCKTIPGVRNQIVFSLQDMLHNNNSYVTSLKSAMERMSNDEFRIVISANKIPEGEHERRLNAPFRNEVSILIVGHEFEKRYIILEKRSSGLIRIAETHRSYDSLQYPLIFGKEKMDTTLKFCNRIPLPRVRILRKKFPLWTSTHIVSWFVMTTSTLFNAAGIYSTSLMWTCMPK